MQRLRKRFTALFTDILKTQLVLKGIVTLEDWSQMKEHIQYDFLQDGHFAELKKAELLEDRINALGSIENYIGTFYSKEWVQKNVLNMTDAEIDEMQTQINKEAGLDPEDGGVTVPTDTDGVTAEHISESTTKNEDATDGTENSDAVEISERGNVPNEEGNGDTAEKLETSEELGNKDPEENLLDDGSHQRNTADMELTQQKVKLHKLVH